MSKPVAPYAADHARLRRAGLRRSSCGRRRDRDAACCLDRCRDRLRRSLRASDRRPRGRRPGAAGPTGSTSSTGSSPRWARGITSSRRATACSGTTATGVQRWRARDRGGVPRAVPTRSRGQAPPVRVECEDAGTRARTGGASGCEAVGVNSGASLGAPGTETVTRLVVALAARRGSSARRIAARGRASGEWVFARFDDEGRALELLDDAATSGAPCGRATAPA